MPYTFDDSLDNLTLIFERLRSYGLQLNSQDVEENNSLVHADQVNDQSRMVTRPVGRSVDWSVTVDNRPADEDVMQISGAGHWFWMDW